MSRRKRILFWSVIFCFTLPVSGAYAQQFSITGKVKSKLVNLPFATVIIQKSTDTSFNVKTWTDTAGTYHFDKLAQATYRIKVTSLGYKRFESTDVVLNSNKTFDVELLIDQTQLKEVSVSVKKKLFETNKGKLIFNVQNSTLTSGQTALDMLKKVPGVTLGQNDEVIFRGSGGINVMMNGRMTYLAGAQLVNLLKGMSAEDISRIELSTTPTAELDAAGNAGVINIVSKKSQNLGYAIDIRSGVSKGKNWMTNQNISAGLNTKTLRLYGAFDFNTPQTFSDNRSSNSVNNNGQLIRLERKSDFLFKSKYYTKRFEADWKFNPKHQIGLIYHGYLDDWNGSKNSFIDQFNSQNMLQSRILTKNTLIEPYHYDSGTFNYGYTIDSLGKKITAEANYTSYRNFSDGLMTTNIYGKQGDFLGQNLLKQYQPGFIKIFSAKTDAELPFKKVTIKMGLKYAEVSNDNQFRFDSLQGGNFVKVEELSNHFKYKERIAAIYSTAIKKFNQTNIEIGMRLEHTNADGYTLKQDISNVWQYTKLFPSLAVEQAINENNKINFSFSRRINRPSYTDLNPVKWYNDKYFYFSGNPNLVPELAWVYALTYAIKDEYIFSVGYNQGINFINRKLSIDDDGIAIRSTSDNFGERRRFDFTASVPVHLCKFWDVQMFADLSHSAYPISMRNGEKQFSLWSLTATMQQNFTLPKNFKINLAGYYYSAEALGIYQSRPTGSIDFGIKKSMLAKRLNMQFSVRDIFNTDRYQAASQTDIVDYKYNDKRFTRIFGLSLTYHFGGELKKSGTRKTEEQERL
ncbi:outer membrane beta-barrel protein [Pedobacter jamesrossensis]|uniref:Outer membrane beta-barrel protein n=2 Tax=Pedobacter jamesrossensis TaxID=1908238 RepID=A0ABV8NQA4_9SPHI